MITSTKIPFSSHVKNLANLDGAGGLALALALRITGEEREMEAIHHPFFGESMGICLKIGYIPNEIAI